MTKVILKFNNGQYFHKYIIQKIFYDIKQMDKEKKIQMQINDEIEEKGNFFILWEEINENQNLSDTFDKFEELFIVQEKTTASQWKRLKNKISLNLNNIYFINYLISGLTIIYNKNIFLKLYFFK